MGKKQLNILRNVMWLYSCGPPKVPTYRTRAATQKKVNEWTVFMMERGFLHRIFSHTFYWWTWQWQAEKNPRQINNSSRTIYLAEEKNRETFFTLVKAKIIFFRFGLLVSLFCCCFCCVWWKFQRMWMFKLLSENKTVKYAKWLK